MPRRYVFKVKDIHARRGCFWAMYYDLRGQAKNMSVDVDNVLRVISLCVPEPVIEVDGSIYEPLDVTRAQGEAVRRLRFPDSVQSRDLMCRFFWTEAGWMEYVRIFQSLPEPVEDYYLLYDKERDGGRLVPMSSKPTRAPVRSAGERGDVPKPVDNLVGKVGESQVQVASIRYK